MYIDMSDLSLMSILSGQCKADPVFAKKIQQVKATKDTILKTAIKLNEAHKEEIEAGTERRKLLLEDGKRRGLKEEEIFLTNEIFMPQKDTPVLNFCFFITRDIDKNLSLLKEEYDKKYSDPEHTDIDNRKIPDQGQFIYGNLDISTFNKIKKLKALTLSENINEATTAFKACRSLCEKYELNYDKIPAPSKQRDEMD
ncbi:MAG: hypothetical protein NT034_02930 [Candidatus Magasanikbacteria bacterium]|nr:hypothetical protein [Candidatus Magasanikbacteria bacterium]